jgi:hypothetical protein
MRMTLNGSQGSVGRVNSMKTFMVEKYPVDYALVVKGLYNGEARGFYYIGSNTYQSDLAGQTVTHAQLLAAAQAGSPLTWTVVHPSTKIRHGVDRDSDGIFDYQDGDAELALSLYLEGAFTGSGMRTDLRAAGLLPGNDPYGDGEALKPELLERTGSGAPVDWVWLELRDGADAAEVIDGRACLVLANGEVVMADGTAPVVFPLAPRGSYYVMATHRNHLGVMTAAAYPMGQGVLRLDLRSSAVTTFGTDAQRTIGNVRALWAGDVNGDGVLRYTGASNDRDPVLSRIGGSVPTATAVGYFDEDVDLNGIVRYSGAANDRDPLLQNIGGSVPTNTRVQQLP